MMDVVVETIEKKRSLTSMSQSAQRLLSGSLSRARSIRSCLSLTDKRAILFLGSGSEERESAQREKQKN